MNTKIFKYKIVNKIIKLKVFKKINIKILTNGNIDSVEFSKVVRKLRNFFEHKGFVEVHTQNRLSILAACEDPDTMTTYKYSNEVWPLPQTGQMWLEYELLKNPELPGLFCVSTSYRNEPTPVPGRHELIFPMFEFEMKGDMQDLLNMEKELMQYLGFKTNTGDYNYPEDDYENVAKKYNVSELENEHEEQLVMENIQTHCINISQKKELLMN